MYSSCTGALALLASVLVALVDCASANSVILADGNWFQSGSISSTFRWQASGPLSSGRCPRQVVALKWGTCYTSELGATGNLQSTTEAQYLASKAAGSFAARSGQAEVAALAAVPYRNATRAMLAAEQRALQDDEDLDAYFEAFPEQLPYRFSNYVSYSTPGQSFKAKRQVQGCGSPSSSTTVPPTSTTTSAPTSTATAEVSPRQRNEFLTWPGAVAGQTWRYTWKTWQRTTSTNFNFHHAWQILRRDGCGGAVVTLDYLNNQVVITDTVRDCKPCVKYNKDISYWFNKEVRHDLTITYGLSGSINYKAYLEGNVRVPAVYYRATGDMGSSASLKVGNYRRSVAGQSASSNYIGDFVQTRIS